MHTGQQKTAEDNCLLELGRKLNKNELKLHFVKMIIEDKLFFMQKIKNKSANMPSPHSVL